MALIDVLPAFKYKPIDLGAAYSKLVPKTTTTEVQPPIITTPIAPETNSVIAQPITQMQSIPTKLPTEYQAMSPLTQALDKSTITNPYAKLAVLAQMGLEKGWKTPKDFSYGNIIAGNAWKGPTQSRRDNDALGNPIVQKFRSYKSADEFVDDYLNLLKNTYPEAYNTLHSDNFSISKFTKGLVGGKYKYAESPSYADSLKNVYTTVKKKIKPNT